MDNVDTFVDNVDNFVDMWVKFDILGRKLVKKGDKFQDIGVNEQKYNVDKMETTWGKTQNTPKKFFKIVDNVDNFLGYCRDRYALFG